MATLTVNTIHSAAYSCLRERDQSCVKNTIRLSKILPLFLLGLTQLVIRGSCCWSDDPSPSLLAAPSAAERS